MGGISAGLAEQTHREGRQCTGRLENRPQKSGKSGCMGDIGTHAAHLAEYITGAKISKICADLNIMVEGRALDDDGNVLLKFDNGAAGVLMASQVAAGEENALRSGSMEKKAALNGRNMNPIHCW